MVDIYKENIMRTEAGITEDNLYEATAAFRAENGWYLYVNDDNGRSKTVMVVDELPAKRDLIVKKSFRTRFRIAVDYDPEKVTVIY